MNELALFADVGGGILGGTLLGWRTVCAVENDTYCARVLLERQNDGSLPPFPIWDDVRTFDGYEWRGRVDVVSGGFPCQDISEAGKGTGINGQHSGLWKEFARIIREVRPQFAFVENSPQLTRKGLGTVLGDLAAMGFHAKWGVLGASDVGAYHRRKRIWIVANALQQGQEVPRGRGRVERRYTVEGCAGQTCGGRNEKSHVLWESEPRVDRTLNGVAYALDRHHAIGNGQVPLVAATAWRILNEPSLPAKEK